ncbi:MAG TPA: hypothetical protein VEI03_15235 [Stellaceae bacterium]|nr:hypothetical protein [Stellaceae bacterium]
MHSAPVITAVAALLLVAAVDAARAADKEPPACAALTFRPVPSGLSDGEQNAGLYKSRFGRIEVMATVKNGEAVDYAVNVNGKPPSAIAGALPASVATCAKAKRLGAIGNPPDHCIGDKLAVLIDHTGAQRYVLLYAHRGNEWHFCSAGGA